jgi:hypothetical protein
MKKTNKFGITCVMGMGLPQPVRNERGDSVRLREWLVAHPRQLEYWKSRKIK